MKLAIGMPTNGLVKAQTVSCLSKMFKALDCKWDFILNESSAIHFNRERIVRQAIRFHYTHLLFIDSDMWFQPEAANQLIARDKDIIGVNANFRKFPLKSTVRLLEKQTEGKEILLCESIGMGFTLIKTEVFKNLPQPWFFWKSNERGELVEGEDYWFCSLARRAGFKIWVDLTVSVKHEGSYLY